MKTLANGEGYAALSERGTSPDRPLWFGDILNYVPHDWSIQSVVKFFRDLGILKDIIGKDDWWGLGLRDVLIDAYGVNVSAGSPFDPARRSTRINFALARKSECPLARHADVGYLPTKTATASLCTATADFEAGAVDASMSVRCMDEGNEKVALRQPLETMQAIGSSSSFWNADIITTTIGSTSLSYDILKGWLESYTLEDDDGEESSFYAMDGGIVDTTGIVTYLQDKFDAIVLFYNDNNNLHSQNASLAFLFGVDSTTNSMNSVEGPTLEQVFETELYDVMMANLTTSSTRAHFENVSVLENTYLGVEAYTLRHLYILSNQYTDAFVDTFEDAEIASHLTDQWPNGFSVGMDTFSANMLCLYNQWKVEQYGDDIRRVIGLEESC